MRLPIPILTSPTLKTHALLEEIADALRSQAASSVIQASNPPVFSFPPTPPLVPLTDFTSSASGLKGVTTTSLPVDGVFGTPVYWVLYNGQLSGWSPVTDGGSPSDDIVNGVVKSGDYNASTNPKVFNRVFGTSE